MKVAIVGTREPQISYSEFKQMFGELILSYNPDVIVSGGAPGIDTYAKLLAGENGILLEEYLPDYSKYGKLASVKRNTDIVLNSTIVLAFPSKTSKGTYDTINKARRYNRQVVINII